MNLTKMFRTYLLMIITLISSVGISKNLLIVGDSLSAAYNIPLEKGWVTLLQTRLNQQNLGEITVVNASISGETTGNALKRFPQLLDQHKPSIVLIELGGNDGLRGFSLEAIKANLIEMVSLAKQAQAEVILTGIHVPPNYGPAYAQLFYKTFLDLSKTYDTYFIPFILDNVGENPELMQADGIHPTADAQPLVLDNMWPTILESVEKLKAE